MDKGKGPKCSHKGQLQEDSGLGIVNRQIWGSRAEGQEVVEGVQGKKKGQQTHLLIKRLGNVLGQEKLMSCFVGYRAAENISHRKHRDSHSSTVEGNSKLLQ